MVFSALEPSEYSVYSVYRLKGSPACAPMQFTALKVDRAQVYLLFYKPSKTDPLLNKVVALVDGPFCHVEIAFPERFGEEPWEREVWGSSVYQGESIFFQRKTYQRDGYVSFAIELSVQQMLRLKAYCRAQTERGVAFSQLAMYAAYLPFQVLTTDDTFCSKHVTLALQDAAISEVMHLKPALVTPSSLYRTLQVKASPIVQMVPGKMTVQKSLWSAQAMAEDMLLVSRQQRGVVVEAGSRQQRSVAAVVGG